MLYVDKLYEGDVHVPGGAVRGLQECLIPSDSTWAVQAVQHPDVVRWPAAAGSEDRLRASLHANALNEVEAVTERCAHARRRAHGTQKNPPRRLGLYGEVGVKGEGVEAIAGAVAPPGRPTRCGGGEGPDRVVGRATTSRRVQVDGPELTGDRLR